MFHIIDAHGSPVTTGAGEIDTFTTLREADAVAVALTRSTKQEHRAVPVTVDLRDDREPEPVVDLRPTRRLTRVLRPR